MYTDRERSNMDWEERVWGYTGAEGMIQGFAAGYFLWDLFVCAGNVGVFGFGLLAHAIAALVVFSLGFVSLPCLVSYMRLKKADNVIATISQLLWPYFHPLRAVFTLPQFSLVL